VYSAANLLPQTPPTPVEVRLSLDAFEKAINMLELMHFDAVKAWWEEQQSGEQQQTVTVNLCSFRSGERANPHWFDQGKQRMSWPVQCMCSFTECIMVSSGKRLHVSCQMEVTSN
jgi:hypothetical protein